MAQDYGLAGSRPVKLYVYDLSRGMARQFSQALIGRMIEAVYHTSIVIGSTEYYYGRGIQYSTPGATHHGAPMEVIELGTTMLADDVITEYLASMKQIYTPEAYDLFMNNCNNFTNDFAMFLVGKGIPSKIVGLPQEVLETPFGQMLRPTIENAMRPITQAPTASSQSPYGGPSATPSASNSHISGVRVISNMREMDTALQSAKNKVAVVFFTSAGCPPCRTIYPHFEELAAEHPTKAVFLKVDVGVAYDVGSKYQISATPTFITYVRNEKVDEWKGAHPGTLRANVNSAISIAFPPHPHWTLRLPTTLSSVKNYPVLFKKMPPLDKLIAKIGDLGTQKAVVELKEFLALREKQSAREATVPNLSEWANFVQKCVKELPLDKCFPIIDLFRVALVDPRVSAWFAEQKDHETISAILTAADGELVPYSFRLVTLQLACNLSSSTLFPPQLISPPLSNLLVLLITSSLLDTDHSQSRVAASSLAFNMAAYNQKKRSELEDPSQGQGQGMLSDDDSIQLVASIIEAIDREQSSAEAKQSGDALRVLLLSLALLIYGVDTQGELAELVRVLGAGKLITSIAKKPASLLGTDGSRLCKEVGEELIGKGLAKK